MAKSKRPVISDKDAEHLRWWCGILGHRFVVVYDLDGTPATHGECNDVKTAGKWAKDRASQNGRVFNQYKVGKWRPVIW